MKLQDLIYLKPHELHKVTEDDLGLFKPMVSWFNPLLLFKLLRPVIICQIFGEYADRRLIHAALDSETDIDQLRRADLRTDDPQAPVWFDYVSDLGDGFDATYAIAYLLAQPSLKVDGHELPRGSLVVMGGDEVYPYATTEDYVLRTRHPYGFALPFVESDTKPPLIVAVPGNHDWYDGLARFLANFCRKEPTPIGGWRTRQRRSYFAARLSESWWLWGIDIALIEDMDQPQHDYFATVAGHMDNANLILCSSEPGWYNAAENSKAFRSLGFAAGIAGVCPSRSRNKSSCQPAWRMRQRCTSPGRMVMVGSRRPFTARKRAAVSGKSVPNPRSCRNHRTPPRSARAAAPARQRSPERQRNRRR